MHCRFYGFNSNINDLPATCDGIAKTIQPILCGLVKQVDFVFDVYYSPSIKDHDATEVDIKIIGSRSEKNERLSKGIT